MLKSLLRFTILLGAGFSLTLNSRAATDFVFCCKPENDLYSGLTRSERRYPIFTTPHEAIANAKPGATVFVLADNWPKTETTIQDSDVQLAAFKDIWLYVECPPAAAFPKVTWSAPKKVEWERIVISTDSFGDDLPKMKILALNNCNFQVAQASNPMLSLARVAGFDTAIYGLPTNAFPILFQIPEKNVFIATAKLSGFNTGRFAPAKAWKQLWEKLLTALDQSHSSHQLKTVPAVTTAYTADDKLPRHFEKEAFDRAAKWVMNSHLLVHPSWFPEIEKDLKTGVNDTAAPTPNEPTGDGSLGILEGYSSGVHCDGNQLRRTPLRADCNTEIALLLALDANVNHNGKSAKVAQNLLDYVYFKSDMCQGARADTNSGAYGLIGWGAISPDWVVANYGDDNACAMIATMGATVSLKNSKWDEMLMKGLIANFRTSGKFGFRGDRLDNPALQKDGWKHYYDAETVNYSPHFESMLWACDFWAYRQTHYQPFLERARTGLTMLMKGYPSKWRWNDKTERAHILVALSWLVRVDDTPEHRQWLKMVATDLIQSQEPSGAIREQLGGTGGGHYQIPQSNEAYGTGETPLIQKNGDPACDQLYMTGYAILGLHEAVGATGDPELKRAEDKLADFLCRIQIRSKQFPYLNGWWFRAFDDRDWEFWSSSADAGWGAWSVEAGWGQSWMSTTLALRHMNTTLWDMTASSRVADHFEKLKGEMLPDVQ